MYSPVEGDGPGVPKSESAGLGGRKALLPSVVRLSGRADHAHYWLGRLAWADGLVMRPPQPEEAFPLLGDQVGQADGLAQVWNLAPVLASGWRGGQWQPYLLSTPPESLDLLGETGQTLPPGLLMGLVETWRARASAAPAARLFAVDPPDVSAGPFALVAERRLPASWAEQSARSGARWWAQPGWVAVGLVLLGWLLSRR
jgi:hypothetical protein